MKTNIENRKPLILLATILVALALLAFLISHFFLRVPDIGTETILFVVSFLLMLLLVWQVWLRKRDKEKYHEGQAVLENELFVRREMENVVQQFTTDLQKASQDLEDSNEKLKNSERLLKEANATKDKFFSILAHDLRSPLGSMMNLAQLFHLQYDNQTDARRKEFIRMILSASQQVYALLENLLQWSRSQSDRLQIFPVYMEVEELFRSNRELLGNLAEEKQITIQMEVEDSLGVRGDKNMLTTTIRNLLSNAIKFTNEGGTIWLKAHKLSDASVQIQVIDNGVGMSKELSRNLFNAKALTTSRGTQNETGTGLGLLVCNEFVKLHKGQIHVDSKPGQGTVFTVELPVYYQ